MPNLVSGPELFRKWQNSPSIDWNKKTQAFHNNFIQLTRSHKLHIGRIPNHQSKEIWKYFSEIKGCKCFLPSVLQEMLDHWLFPVFPAAVSRCCIYKIPQNVFWVLSIKWWNYESMARLLPFCDRELNIIIYSELELSIYEVGDWKLSLRFSLNLQGPEGIYGEALVSLTTSAARMPEQKGKLPYLLRVWMYLRVAKDL